GERNGVALLHQSRCGFALRRSDEVDGSQLIGFAPAAPVGQLLHPAIERGLVDRWVSRKHYAHDERKHKGLEDHRRSVYRPQGKLTLLDIVGELAQGGEELRGSVGGGV